jgi:hypothetical protein
MLERCGDIPEVGGEEESFESVVGKLDLMASLKGGGVPRAQGYGGQIGDAANDHDLEGALAATLAVLVGLEVGEVLLMKRSSGEWTYAEVHEVVHDDTNIASLKCLVDVRGNTKVLRADYFEIFLRRFPPENQSREKRLPGHGMEMPLTSFG